MQMNNDYSYSIDQCDATIANREALHSYREKRRMWLSWIDTDEYHAISRVLSSMAWVDVSFRMLRYFAANDDQNCLHNSLLSEALLEGHLATQVLAIRRLMDNRKDGNISLVRLLKDLKRNFALLTRENYVCFDGLPYDYQAVQQRIWATHTGSAILWGATSGPNAYATSEMAHKQFDKLAGINPESRSRQDRLPTSLLLTIENWTKITDLDDLVKWSHVFLAHAGGPAERSRINHQALHLDKISNAIRTFARVTEALSWLLYSGGLTGSLMPTAQFDQFEKLDKSVMNAGAEPDAQKLWKQLSDERNLYLNDLEIELLGIQPIKYEVK